MSVFKLWHLLSKAKLQNMSLLLKSITRDFHKNTHTKNKKKTNKKKMSGYEKNTHFSDQCSDLNFCLRVQNVFKQIFDSHLKSTYLNFVIVELRAVRSMQNILLSIHRGYNVNVVVDRCVFL